MTIQQFILLNEMEKVSVIMEKGILITQHAGRDSRIFVYHLHGFYVSAVYRLSDDRLLEINSFLEYEKIVATDRRLMIAVHPAERAYELPGQ